MNFSASTFTETGRGSQSAASDSSMDQERSSSVLVFHLGERAYGLVIEHVVQIIAMIKLTPVPQVEQVIEGVANIRGKIVPVLSARRHLGLPLVEPQLYTPIILLQTDGRMVGLIVDEVADVVRLPAGQMTSPDAILPTESEINAVLEGVVYHGETVIMVINPRCLLNSAALRAFKRAPNLNSETAPVNTFFDPTPETLPAAKNGAAQPLETQLPVQAEPKKPTTGSGRSKSRKGRRSLSETLAGEIAGLAADLPPTDGQSLPKADLPSSDSDKTA